LQYYSNANKLNKNGLTDIKQQQRRESGKPCFFFKIGTPAEPRMSKPGTTKTGTTFFECDQAKNDQA
jgi:hypothetical protein